MARMPRSPADVLYQVAKLRQELEEQLEPLLKKQLKLERELQEVSRAVDSTRRQLHVVKATEEQLRAQGEPLEGAGVQVSGAVELQLGQPVCRKRGLTSCCHSPRQRPPSRVNVQLRPIPGRRLSPSPRGPFLPLSGKTTWCPC
jgi:hypothetical protein